jgi:hypothetical protein
VDDQLKTGTPAVSPPGWVADPYGRHELRYWDGDEWTEHVSDGGLVATDAVEVASPWSMMSQSTPAPRSSVQPQPQPATATDYSGGWNAPDPAPVPVPAWGPPSQPPVAFAPSIFGAPPAAKRWYQRRLGRVLMVVGGVAVLLFFGYLRFKPPDRIDAQPAAPTPAGFRLVSADEYQFAAPGTWRSQVIDENALNTIADRVEAGAPGAGDALRDAAENGAMEGTKTLAVDPVTGDNVTVIPYKALRGDPRDSDTLAEIKDGFSAAQTGITPTTLTAEPGDVHGFPAAVITLSAPFNGRTMTIISTIIQTGDRVFQLTVTSPSAAQAAALNQQILPTFAPH